MLALVRPILLATSNPASTHAGTADQNRSDEPTPASVSMRLIQYLTRSRTHSELFSSADAYGSAARPKWSLSLSKFSSASILVRVFCGSSYSKIRLASADESAFAMAKRPCRLEFDVVSIMVFQLP